MDDILLADHDKCGLETPMDTTQHTDIHPGAACTYGPGVTLMRNFDSDKYSEHQTQCLLSLLLTIRLAAQIMVTVIVSQHGVHQSVSAA